MIWYDIRDPRDPRIDELTRKYNLHPLHVEDVLNRNQSAKIESQNEYLFVVLKPADLEEDYSLNIVDLDFFIGPDWIITVQEEKCNAVSRALDKLAPIAEKLRPDEMFYRVMDAVVDSYQPIIDRASDRIDEMEDRALFDPHPQMLEEIFDLKRVLIQLRRILANTRDVV